VPIIAIFMLLYAYILKIFYAVRCWYRQILAPNNRTFDLPGI